MRWLGGLGSFFVVLAPRIFKYPNAVFGMKLLERHLCFAVETVRFVN
jgi:hypothetical protein